MPHPELMHETRHLAGVLARVEQELADVAALEGKQHAELVRLRRAAGGAYDNDLFVLEKLYQLTSQKLADMHHATGQAYFARVDFCAQGDAQPARHYIGKWGLTDAATLQSVIVDWRSPIANLYYGAQVGAAEYDTPDGPARGELVLKRIFQLSGAHIQRIIDADVVTQDSYLHGVLSDHAGSRLKDIVSTIQAEQNAIIRHDYRRAMIVQGVAGAGKTTVALHRITWLLYTYRGSMAPENLMVLAPNPLFLNYISAVLPELGAQNVLQVTFHELGELLTGCRLPPLRDSDTLLALLALPPHERKQPERVARLKGSLAMRACIDAWFAQHIVQGIGGRAFTVAGACLLDGAAIHTLLTRDLSPHPYKRRVEQLRSLLQARAQEHVRLSLLALESDTAKRANYIRAQLPEDSPRRRAAMQRLYAARDQRRTELEGSLRGAADAYTQPLWPAPLLQSYRAVLSPHTATLPGVAVDRADWAHLCADTLARLDTGHIETADIAPLIHVNGLLFGAARRLDIHHSVIDEAQDFSTFQFDVLKRITRNQSFTIAGDLTQGIYAYRGVYAWQDVITEVFGADGADYLQLVTSYRNTVEIMTLAERVAAKFPFAGQRGAQPVLRHGEPPQLHPRAAKAYEPIARQIGELLDQGMKTIAVVGKLPDECTRLYRALRKRLPADIPLHRYTDADRQYHGGVMVIPAHLVKGLEFDAVIIADAGAGNFPADALHCRMLYVCMTRPLHRLSLFYVGELSALLG